MYQIEKDGVEILPGFVSAQQLAVLRETLSQTFADVAQPGIRNLAQKCPAVSDLVRSPPFVTLAQRYLPGAAQPFRVTLFNKSLENNWLVPWHQDRMIAVDARAKVPGWGPWSRKEGVHHVQPPAGVLAQMISFRLALDDSDRDNGCLQVIPKSHKHGILSMADSQQLRQTHAPYCCEAKAGDLTLMRPLILHASPKAKRPGRRWVLHVEYSACPLPKGLKYLDL